MGRAPLVGALGGSRRAWAFGNRRPAGALGYRRLARSCVGAPGLVAMVAIVVSAAGCSREVARRAAGPSMGSLGVGRESELVFAPESGEAIPGREGVWWRDGGGVDRTPDSDLTRAVYEELDPWGEPYSRRRWEWFESDALVHRRYQWRHGAYERVRVQQRR